ncbi:hypothetical protein [uncultured Brevundimonas sp.]|uniref:hypothetical protein n=1 Tax=uncultured Brevundimonas sp. TaxID=213418 RepID=UPI0030EEA0C3|tara:strand:+ start:737 stop:1195 length:459 start_codon:yes stop_codon:yes gene_type:complete
MLSVGCGELDPRARDAALAEQFEMDRTGFQDAVDLMTTEPVMQRVDRRSDGSVSAQPLGADPARVGALAGFMEKHEILTVEGGPPNTSTVAFRMYSSGIAVSGQLKSILYSQTPPDGPVVQDTDVEIAQPSDQWRVVYRRLADDWYIKNSCC